MAGATEAAAVCLRAVGFTERRGFGDLFAIRKNRILSLVRFRTVGIDPL